MISISSNDQPKKPPVDYSALTQQVRDLQIQLENSFFMTVAQRLGCLFQKLYVGSNYTGLSFTLPVTKGTLALRTGIENETFSRNVPKLKTIGIAIHQKVVTFESLPKLRASVCDHCAGQADCIAFKILHKGSS